MDYAAAVRKQGSTEVVVLPKITKQKIPNTSSSSPSQNRRNQQSNHQQNGTKFNHESTTTTPATIKNNRNYSHSFFTDVPEGFNNQLSNFLGPSDISSLCCIDRFGEYTWTKGSFWSRFKNKNHSPTSVSVRFELSIPSRIREKDNEEEENKKQTKENKKSDEDVEEEETKSDDKDEKNETKKTI